MRAKLTEGEMLDLKKVEEAIVAAHGNVTATARQLGIGKRTLWRWMEMHPQLQRAANKARRALKKDATA
jgi:transcriptional regulator of acetoin/glycerol metabolism